MTVDNNDNSTGVHVSVPDLPNRVGEAERGKTLPNLPSFVNRRLF
jgi:hypothetical protein